MQLGRRGMQRNNLFYLREELLLMGFLHRHPSIYLHEIGRNKRKMKKNQQVPRRAPSRGAASQNESPQLELSWFGQHHDSEGTSRHGEGICPSVLCVLETQVRKTRVEGLKSTLGFDNSFAVSSLGRSGGIGLFWNNEIKVEILSYSQYHIDAIATESCGDQWRLTTVYEEAQTSKRCKTWDMLKFIKSSSALPWVCVGDFNEVLHRSEHVGVQERSYAQIAGFREMVDVCGLYDRF